jgi:hypothetical protein
VLDNQRPIGYNKKRMKQLSIPYSRIIQNIVPLLMLALLLSGIAVSAFHNHHDCGNPDNCAICTFQASACALSFDVSPGSDAYADPVLLSSLSLPEWISLPFHTHVFASHAPPQFS